jgi:hypothetical protein
LVAFLCCEHLPGNPDLVAFLLCFDLDLVAFPIDGRIQESEEKKECSRCMHLDRSVDNVERYKVVKKTVKQAVSEARGQMYDGLYQRLGTKEGEKDIYRMAKSRERKTRDIIQVKCIKDATERLLTKDENIKNRWREYFDKLFNEDSGSSSIELDISLDDLNRQFVRRIQESEVKDPLKRM